MAMTFEQLVQYARENECSDIHITVGTNLAIRRFGTLMILDDVPTADESREMIFSILDEQQRKYVSSGKDLDVGVMLPGGNRIRANIYHQRNNLAASIRLFQNKIPTFEELGLPSAVHDLARTPRGLILVTGPTGSGKSTTLASIINTINHRRDAHIITLEDPIEYLHMHKRSVVNQREIGMDSGSYANALRAALREDPDVILVGEMRDLETISTAITAAETGHLVLSTLHTIGAASTVDRVIDVFPPHQQQQIRIQLAGVLEAIISQQLIPTYDGKGRVAAFEVLLANHAIRNLIREGKSHQIMGVMQTNKAMGMITMDEAICNFFYEGKIDRDQAIHFAQDPDAMEIKI